MILRLQILWRQKKEISQKADMIDTIEHKDTLLSNERKCIVTGEIRDRNEMYRFIIDPDNQILPDLAAKLPGRGFWVWPINHL